MSLSRPSPFLFLFLLGLCLLNFRLAAARLYPIRPVSGTEYHCQKCDPIRWIDDGKQPSVQSMGLLTVDLYCLDPFLYVFTIDGGVDPDAGEMMFCPPRDFPWPKDCPLYTLAFTGENDNHTVFPHPFKIFGTSRVFSDEASLSASAEVNNSTFTLVSTASSSISTPTATASAMNQRPQGYDSSSTTMYADPLPSGSSQGGDIDRVHHKYHGGAFSWRGMDTEKMKFRFVFIVWPALIGISMAL